MTPSRQSSGQFSGQDVYYQLRAGLINSDDKKRIQHFPLSSFLPLDIIDAAITADIVEIQLPWLNKVTRLLNLNNFPYQRSRQIVEQARKVFAILVLCGEEALIWALFDEGLTDADLPLASSQVAGCSNTPNDPNSYQSKRFESFSKLGKSRAADSFIEKQWLVLAPVFTARDKHINVNEAAPLPFYNIETVTPSQGSTVYKGVLHIAHLAPKPKDHVKIAIKDYVSENDFWREKGNLEEIQKLDHPHLIRHIATVQQGNLFCAILPWADGGNLSDFWKRDPDACQTRHPDLFLWCLRQMLGLVDALYALHSVNCRHGDLKPDNILNFHVSTDSTLQSNPYGTLVITDVGVSRVHHQATELRSDPTNTKATTIRYEAPEAELAKGARSRKYDMWSVGCVFMEFVIWLLYGQKAIIEFGERRRVNEKRYPPKGAYYYQEAADGPAVIHHIAYHGFDALRNDPRCGKDTGLAEVISLITNDLIVIVPEKRMKAEELRERLKSIIQMSEKDPNYLIKKIEPPPSIPDIFLPGG